MYKNTGCKIKVKEIIGKVRLLATYEFSGIKQIQTTKTTQIPYIKMSPEIQLRDNFALITEQIVSSYQEHQETHHLGHCQMPSFATVAEVIKSLKELIFPGYWSDERLHIGNIHYYVGVLVDRLHHKLRNQISRALCHGESKDFCCSPEQREKLEKLGHDIALDFLRQIPAIRTTLADDVQAAYDGDPACKSLDEVIFCYPGLEAITVHRLAHALHQLKVPYLPRMMSEWAHYRTGIDIHPGARIGNSFFIDHGTGVVIGETCEIGDHVKLYQGVTLGALSFNTDGEGNLVRDQKRHPTVEDGVVVYANATVLGGRTTLGKGCVIGASTWITKSVAPGERVILLKPKMKVSGGENGEMGKE